MNNRQKILSSAVIMACSAISTQAQAVLVSGAILKFNNGVGTCVLSGTYPSSCYLGVTSVSGSYFSMDTNADGSDGNSSAGNERIPISLSGGLVIGSAQPTSGQSHSFAPTGKETTTIDLAWAFFGNTGMHNTNTAITVTSGGDDGAGNVTLDMGGWAVDWNAIENIPMGGDTANFASDTGIGTLTCYSDSAFTAGNETDCLNGTFFTLSYSAHVPTGDASGFGGVTYNLHMEGSIFILPPSLVGSGSLASGDFGGTSVTSYRSTSTLPADTGYTQSGSTFDFKINCGSAGCSESVILPLGISLPANAIYRKYSTASGWTTFTEDANNTLASAASSGGTCPASASAYSADLTTGDDCILLTMRDGDANDADGDATNGIIADPGVIAVSTAATEANDYSSSTSGCSMSETPVNLSERADWWLVAGFLGALGWLRLYRRRSSNQG